MRGVLKFVAALGVLIVIATAAPFAQTGKSFRDASGTFVEQGYAALEAEKGWKALVIFEKAIVANPHNVDAYIGLGKAHEWHSSISGGLRYYAIALELDPRNLAAWEAKIAAHLVISQLGEAQAALLRIQAVCGDKPCLEAALAEAAIDAYQAKVVASAKKP